MRAAWLLLALIPAAGCQVNVEGAPCVAPGKLDDCPEGQACGNDLRCSKRAAACADETARCRPGVTPSRCRTNGSAIEKCTSADPVCGTWAVAAAEDDCASASLACVEWQGTRVCEGAVCTAPWIAGECPAGQACGNDLRCTTSAAACVDAGVFCKPSIDPDRCHANAVERCTDSDPICGAWSVQEDCAVGSRVCETSAVASACLGKRCSDPGTAGATAGCPDDQACGNDLRCSTKAAQCLADQVFCKPSPTLKRCHANAVETCTPADAVCGLWAVVEAAVDDCTASSLVCNATNTTCVCRVPTAAEGIAVDVAARASPLVPTGATQPQECRFGKLGAAVAAAAARGTAITVKAYGAAGAQVVFTGETLPIVVPPEVTISGADSPAAETIIRGDAGTATTAIVTLKGTLDRVQIQNVSMKGSGVDAVCGTIGRPTLRDVVLAGAQELARGVSVSGDCGALLERADISGASGPALDISPSSAASTLTVKGSRFHGSGAGIRVSGGTLVLGPDGTTSTAVTSNKGIGILFDGLNGTAPAVDATLTGVAVAQNEGTGVFVDRLPTTSKLRLMSCEVRSNGSVSPTIYGPVGNTRGAGGILLNQTTLSIFQLQDNRIYGNHGGTNVADEVAFNSSGTWSLSTGACETANRIGCVAGYAVNATAGTVDAAFGYWEPLPPTVPTNVINTGTFCGTWTCPP
jgi:hypothetical protein